MAVALTLYEDGMCTCGYPAHVCHHPENDGYFEVDRGVCYAAAAVEQYRGAEGYVPEAGERLGVAYVRDLLLDPLPALDGRGDAAKVSDHDQNDAQQAGQ